MLNLFLAYLKSKQKTIFITLFALFIISLGYAGILSWNSPVEKTAEEVLKDETGVIVNPSIEKS